MEHHKLIPFLRYSLALLLFLAISAQGDLVPNYDHKEAKLKVFEIKQPLVLFCNVTEAGNHEIQWSRNGTSVENLADLKGRHTVLKSEHKLVIDRAQESDAGLYTCSLPRVGQSKDINVVANVAVKLPSNMAVVEGERLAIQCIVVGTDPIINWTILDNFTASEANSELYSYLPDEKNVKDAILVIESARLTDRGNYSCEANNIATQHRITKPAVAVTFVRVKGKLAALWPFLGICAEVFVLCAIILVYEKRRNKADPDESDTDQSPEQKLDPHGKESDVRQRK
uniref:Putative basigin n=1 Tax=Nyssomyia neivai TaxID=330878 RepID=A0A1L8DA04_9DIPT